MGFLSTPSARRATPFTGRRCPPVSYFYPRPPRGGRHTAGVCRPDLQRFLSTPSARRATICEIMARRVKSISIHALREEGDGRARLGTVGHDISIHALREEGDNGIPTALAEAIVFLSTPSARRATPLRVCGSAAWWRFLSTPSARRATRRWFARTEKPPYFYPRPPRGGRRLRGHGGQGVQRDFYPRPPRGGRPGVWRTTPASNTFLSTPSARRATC